MQYLKFISSINLSLFGSPRNERSTYIKYFNCSWSIQSSHSRATLSAFLFISSKRISSLVFVGYGVDSCFSNEDINSFTSSFIISTRLLLLHLRIQISSYSLLLPFTDSFIISTRLILLRLHIPISSSSLLLPFTDLFIISTWLSLLHLFFPISSSLLLLASLQCGIYASELKL